MGLFKNKHQIQLTHLENAVARVKYQERDFPLIEMTFVVEDHRKVTGKKTEVNEVVITMTLWEANAVLDKLVGIVNNTTQMAMHSRSVAIPWDASGGGLPG